LFLFIYLNINITSIAVTFLIVFSQVTGTLTSEFAQSLKVGEGPHKVKWFWHRKIYATISIFEEHLKQLFNVPGSPTFLPEL
jgi:hypothetical protein